MVAPGNNSKTVELKIDMTFTADDLERDDALSDLGFSDEGASTHEDFMSACAFFFYIAILPQKFADVTNALHAAWQTKHKKPCERRRLGRAAAQLRRAGTDVVQATIDYMPQCGAS